MSAEAPPAGNSSSTRYREGDSNPHGQSPTDFESAASTIPPSRRTLIVLRLTDMPRRTDRLFRITDEIARIDDEIRLTEGELSMLRHIDDDAQRDAAASGSPIDRDDARMTAGDVARFERALEALRERRDKLDAKRRRLLERLG